MPRQKLTIAGPEGELSALLEYPDHSPVAYALFAHCFSCGKDIAAASRIARALLARGVAVLRFDFTGLGNSDGDFSNTNFSSNVDDLVRAADFLRENYVAPTLLIGHSLGGTAVLKAAGRIPESRAVVTIGSPATPAHVIRQFADRRAEIEREGKAEVDLGGRPFVIKRQFIEDVESVSIDETLAAMKKALLVMHSPLDKVVSVNEAEHLYVKAKHPKSFVSLDSADHLLTDKADAEYVAETIAAWSSRYVEVGSREREATQVDSGEVVVREHNRQFARTVQADQHRWIADEPVDVGGHELGPDPYEHLLAALGTCTSMTLRMYANRKQLPLDDVTVHLNHERTHATDCEGCETAPMRLETITMEIALTGDLSDAQREKLLEIAGKCPVYRTLTGELSIEKRLT